MANAATVLVVDDSPICRDMVCKALRADGLQTLTAEHGMAGLAQLGAQRIDAVVLDNEMPKMSGLPFLKAIRADQRWKSLPVLMLTTICEKNFIMEASQYNLTGYMLKAKLSLPDLVGRIRAAIVKRSQPARAPKPPTIDKLCIPNLVKKDAVLEALSEVAAMRTLRGISSQIATIASSPKPGVAELAAVVKQDPLLAVRTVQLAGSAKYGGTKVRLGAIEDAVRTVGVAAVRDLALSMTVYQSFPIDKADGIDLLRSWQHCLAVAAIMEKIVPKSDQMPGGLPYMLGLVHDLPEILLRQKFPDAFAAALDFAHQSQSPVAKIIPEVFGIPYAEIADTLLDRLQLPADLCAPLKEYQAKSLGGADEHANTLPRALSIANFLAHAALCASNTECLIAPVLKSDCRTALISAGVINFAEIRSESLMTISILSNVSGDKETALMKPLLPKKETVVWYVRPTTFAELDPLDAALNSLAKAKAYDRMPQPNELNQVAAIVIASTTPPPSLSEAQRTNPVTGKRIPVLYLTRAKISDADRALPFEVAPYPLTVTELSAFLATA